MDLKSFDLESIDEGYSRNASCALNYISIFVLHQKEDKMRDYP
jgi:hypothetical protein